jgi:hypothetical protein
MFRGTIGGKKKTKKLVRLWSNTNYAYYRISSTKIKYSFVLVSK